MDTLFEYMYRLLSHTDATFHRYMYQTIRWESRMLGLVGPRGVGKTTLFLQRVQELHAGDSALYVSADHMYFARHSLLEVADSLYKSGGTHLFVDEAHKYPGWSRELKAIYDAYPELHVYFTGSSVLDIAKGEADLSRRAPVYHMQGLSFREWLAIARGIRIDVHTFEQILHNDIRASALPHPLPAFREYLRSGYYPFGGDPDFDIELGQVITRTLETDIPQYAGMSTATGRKLKRLMAVVSTLAPFKPNMTKLAAQIQVSRNNVEDYLGYMERAGMTQQLRTSAGGIGALGKVDKVYLDNTNILYNLSEGSEDIGAVRETFFLNQVRVVSGVRASPVSDFLVDDTTFEVGGRSKGRDQLRGTGRGFVVKDDIEFGHGGTIPLWSFGLLY